MKTKIKFDLLQTLMGLVFLSAGLYRLFFPSVAELELTDLHLSIQLIYPLICFEIVSGVLLLLGAYKKIVSGALMIFLLFAILWGTVLNSQNIFSQMWEVFVFKTNPTDIFLHVVFLFILATIFLSSKTTKE